MTEVCISKMIARAVVIMITCCSLLGCQQFQSGPAFTISKLQAPNSSQPDTKSLDGEVVLTDGATRLSNQRFGLAPNSVPAESSTPQGALLKNKVADFEISLDQAPLQSFIEVIFGKVLKLPYQVDPAIAQRTDLVTFRAPKKMDGEELVAAVGSVLKTFGIRLIMGPEIVRIVPEQTISSEVPQFLRGRSSGDVAAGMRPIFQLLPLRHVPASEMQGWISTAFGKRVQASIANNSTSILLAGLPEDVASAMSAVNVMDQPRLAGKKSLTIEPTFWAVIPLAKKLVELLKAEGTAASVGLETGSTTVFVPVDQINQLFVFSADQPELNHIIDWVRDLDQPAKADPLKRIFVYQVQSTTAESLATVVSSVTGTQQTSISSPQRTNTASSATSVPSLTNSGLVSSLPGQSAVPPTSQPAATATGTGSSQTPGAGGSRIVTDPERNLIIFSGPPEEYAQILLLLRKLDTAPREALIEVTVAEITLNDSTKMGVEFALSGAQGGGYMGALATLGGLGVPGISGTVESPRSGSGFTYALLNSAGATRAVLNALSSKTDTKILLTPRVLTTSGVEAVIRVGDQVPVITSQSSTITTSATPTVLNQIQYLQTGTVLKVKPTVHSRSDIELEISQDVSTASVNQTSTVSSPVISTRALNTKLSMKDGATILLGGLISDQKTNGSTGIPFLEDIPGLGNIFKNQSANINKTELLIFITPYIIDSSDQSEKVAAQFMDGTKSWPNITGVLRW